MDIQQKMVLSIIAKLMDEKEPVISEHRRKFENLYNFIEERLPIVLDEGTYVDNANIIRQVHRILKDKEIFTIIPELANRTMVAIWGRSYSLSKIFKPILSGKLGIELNSNLPLIVIQRKDEIEKQIFALTYMDKLIAISFKEYKYITREIYKENVDIRKLIKGFVIYCQGEYLKESFLFLPEYTDSSNSILEALVPMVNTQILVTYDNDKWKKKIHKILNKELYLLGPKEDYDDLKKQIYNLNWLCKNEEVVNFFDQNNVPCVNYTIALELQSVFLKVIVFYKKKKNSIKEKVTKLTADSLHLQNGNVKQQVQKYRKKLISQFDELEKDCKLFVKVSDEIIKMATDYEMLNSNMLMYDLADDVNSELYIQILLDVFFKHVYSEEYEMAKNDILKLSKANYEYPNACKCFLKYYQGYEITFSDIVKIKKYPDEKAEIAKIKIELSKELGLCIDDLKELIVYVSPIESGKEFFCLGKKFLDEKKYDDAKNAFMKSLNLDYEQSGDELIKLSEKHPECDINIEELAENLVTEANYYVGKENIFYKYKKGVVNLKMAATKNHLGAIEMISDILFEKYQHISCYDMKREDNIHTVNNLISLYAFLEKNQSQEKYRLRMGLMYCKLGDYMRAYSLLKNIDLPEAHYECAKMYQYGMGVAKDLQKAKKHYEQIPFDYEDRGILLDEVRDMINQEKEKREQTSYNEKRDYASLSSYSSDYSDIDIDNMCFVEGTHICLSDNSYKKVEDIAVGDEVLIFDHYTGQVSQESIIANIHAKKPRKNSLVISLLFENGHRLNIANSHILFNVSQNKYICITSENVERYIGQHFAVIEDRLVSSTVLVEYSVKEEYVKYYAPISKYHLNVIAEGILSMPPTDISLKLFNIGDNMMYDTSILKQVGITPYTKLKEYVTMEEYEVLPCCYLDAVLANNDNCDMSSFIDAIRLFREK